MLQVIDTQETYRLISDGQGRYAVVEARCGHVFSLDARHSRQAADCEDGMVAVIGEDGWFDEHAARRCFEEAVRGERRLGRVIW